MGNSLCAQSFSGIFSKSTSWGVTEFTGSTGKIIRISYFIFGGSGGGFSYTLYPPTNWYWLRSQTCWCGGDHLEYATFTQAAGTLYYGSTDNLYAWGPAGPWTGEDSNMGYGCFQKSGTMYPYQTFQLGTHC